jgi:F-type H+-transporting ATPase subunit delta
VAVVHRTYARALFDAAKEGGDLAAAREELGDFVAAMRAVPELRDTLVNPQLDPRAKRSALEGLLSGGDERVRNFLLLLAEKGRIAELEPIYEEFERLVAADEGVLDVELTTAYELSDQEANEIVRQIEQNSGRRVEATRKVDPDLIGGIVMQVGSRRADASVRGRLNRLRQELTTARTR